MGTNPRINAKMTRYIPRLYVEQPLNAAANLLLNAGQSHYLTRVLRRQSGDTVLLFNGCDGEWAGSLTPPTSKNGVVGVTQLQQTLAQPIDPPLTLAFAPLKPAAMAVLIGQATELGVTALQPLRMAHGLPEGLTQANKWHSYRVEAAESSGRCSLPTILPLKTLQQWLQEPEVEAILLWGDERLQAARLPDILRNTAPTGLLIGPEGGFSVEEFAQLQATPWLLPCRLSDRVVRAETAALIGLSGLTLHRP